MRQHGHCTAPQAGKSWWIQLKEEFWIPGILLSALGCGQVAMGTLCLWVWVVQGTKVLFHPISWRNLVFL